MNIALIILAGDDIYQIFRQKDYYINNYTKATMYRRVTTLILFIDEIQ